MKNKVQNIYNIELEKYIQNIKRSNVDIMLSNDRLEFQFESLTDWAQVHKFEYIKKWFLKKRKNPGIKVTRIPLDECKKWSYDKKKGNYFH